MAADGALSFSVASVVEDVLQQHGSRSRNLDLDARRAEEAGNFLMLLLANYQFAISSFVANSSIESIWANKYSLDFFLPICTV